MYWCLRFLELMIWERGMEGYGCLDCPEEIRSVTNYYHRFPLGGGGSANWFDHA